MTTMTSVRLDSAVQALIDSRLDTIDRMLLGRVPRQDRLDIAREVEAQIFDHLQERGLDDPTRDDVLSVLARLDPPEAYLPDDQDDEDTPASPRRPRAGLPLRPAGRGDNLRIARASGILGLVAMGLVFLSPVVYLLGALLESEILLIVGLFGVVGLVFLGGVLAIALGIYARFRQVWSLIGVVSGALAMVAGFVGGVAMILLL